MADQKKQQPTGHGPKPGDDEHQAMESGEPKETGYTRGKPIEEQAKPQGKSDQKEDWESGRQKAN